jgi:hypothetical protein
LKKIDTLKVDTLNVIDIMSMTDDESEREIRHIDINQEVVIPNIEPQSLFSDDDEDDQELDSDGNKNSNKLNRQRLSLNQTKVKDHGDLLLMETSLTFMEQLSPPPYSPPPLPSSLPLESSTSDQPRKHHKHSHHHHHRHRHHKHSHAHSSNENEQHREQAHDRRIHHRHSMAVGRTAPIDERGPPESEIVLSPSKLQ